MLTQVRLKELAAYEPETGVFICKVVRHKSHQIGKEIVGCDNGAGYLKIRIDRIKYPVHRLAWLYVHGRWPTELIDHIDGSRANNRIENLREASNSENLRNRPKNKNNTSGYKGVYWNKQHQKWLVKMVVNGVNHYFGLFEDREEARSVYAGAVERLHGEFARAA